MAETLSSLLLAKYEEYFTRLANKDRRLAEISQADLVRITPQMELYQLGISSGDSSLCASALAELAVIFDTEITPPTSVIGTAPTESNTRRGVSVAVNAGSNTITFTSAFDAATYSLFTEVYTALGGQVQKSVDPSSRTVNGFTIVCASAGRLDYFAILN